ncbi:MAG: TetR/AcrR family transcriptional regulator [Lachnospiraceae bacterium]|nr:TetR/AcrR family transcriptional regulator [Lachnospiraceae bacterium]
MPPKAKITREMILEAGFEIARESGIENVNARTVSQRLDCSTQPVMYHFKKIEDIKREVYRLADSRHTAYIMALQGDNPMLEIGLNYIRFAQTEKQLFRLLFQSDEFSGKDISSLIDSEDLIPVLTVLGKTAGVSITQAKIIFRTLFLFVHGYASMFANNTLEYDEAVISMDLERVFKGAIHLSEEEYDETHLSEE